MLTALSQMACPCARARPRTGACLAFLLALSSLASRAIAQQASDLGALERWLTAKHGKVREERMPASQR